MTPVNGSSNISRNQTVAPMAVNMTANFSQLPSDTDFLVKIEAYVYPVYGEPAFINTTTGKIKYLIEWM